MSNPSLEMMALMQRRLDLILQSDPSSALMLMWQEYRLADEAKREALVSAVFGRLVLARQLQGVPTMREGD